MCLKGRSFLKSEAGVFVKEYRWWAKQHGGTRVLILHTLTDSSLKSSWQGGGDESCGWDRNDNKTTIKNITNHLPPQEEDTDKNGI